MTLKVECCLCMLAIWLSVKTSSCELDSRNSFIPFPNKPWFLRVCGTSLLKTLQENEKLLITSNFSFSHSVACYKHFSFSHSVLYLIEELSVIFIRFEIVVCKLFQFGRV